MASDDAGGLDPAETHVCDRGLWIPPALRTFDTQVVFRTPKATIQHFAPADKDLDPYKGSIDEGDFGPVDELRDPRNAHLAPDQVSIKPAGEDAVLLDVDLEPDLLADGGTRVSHDPCTCEPMVESAVYCPYCGEETYGDDHEVDAEIPEVFCETTGMSTPRYCMGCGTPVDVYDFPSQDRPEDLC